MDLHRHGLVRTIGGSDEDFGFVRDLVSDRLDVDFQSRNDLFLVLHRFREQIGLLEGPDAALELKDLSDVFEDLQWSVELDSGILSHQLEQHGVFWQVFVLERRCLPVPASHRLLDLDDQVILEKFLGVSCSIGEGLELLGCQDRDATDPASRVQKNGNMLVPIHQVAHNVVDFLHFESPVFVRPLPK